jgi:hypothetical protein
MAILSRSHLMAAMAGNEESFGLAVKRLPDSKRAGVFGPGPFSFDDWRKA